MILAAGFRVGVQRPSARALRVSQAARDDRATHAIFDPAERHYGHDRRFGSAVVVRLSHQATHGTPPQADGPGSTDPQE
jgi:hypothetical protein